MARGLAKLIERAADPAPFLGGLSGSLDASNPFSIGGAMQPYGTAPTARDAANVTESTTMALSAAWRCLHILADGIGALEIYAYDEAEGDARIKNPRILSDPWPMVTPVEWRAMVVSSLVMHGEAFLIPYDMDPRTGYPRQLPLIHPDLMDVRVVNGRPRYTMVGSDIPLEVLHIRGLMMPGAVRGIGVVEAQRLGIQLALEMEKYQRGNLTMSSVPPVVIKVNRPEISAEQALDIQSRWIDKHGYGNRTPAVIPTSMDVQTFAWSPEDTQFLESKQYQAAEICWWFGIDPRVLGLAASGQSLTYSNIESTYVDLQRMSYTPWTSRIESALSRVIPRTQGVKFDFAPMLRTTLQDRYSSYKMALEGGWLTIDEVRALENMGPLGSDPSPEHGTIQTSDLGQARQNEMAAAEMGVTP